jgi:hypothetical protein
MNRLPAAMIPWLCVAVLACGGDRASSARLYRVTDRDALSVQVPEGWRDGVRPLPGEPFPSIFLAPAEGEEGGLVLTVLARAGGAAGELTDEQVRQAVEDAANAMESPELSEVRGPQAVGWLATETAEGEAPDSHGVVRVGEIVLTVTVQGDAAMRDRAVSVLETAAHERAE